MKPLSREKRTLYFIFFTCILVLVSPLVVLYSMGNRFDAILGFGQVGGIYVVAPMKETDFFLNDKLIGQSSFFKRSALFQDIHPGSYNFSATKEGYYGWHKNVKILAENVAELYPFMLPVNPVLTPILKELHDNADNAVASTSKKTVEKKITLNPAYKEIANLFTEVLPVAKKPLIKPQNLSAHDEPKEGATIISKGKVDIWYEGKNIFARWSGQAESTPLFFCIELRCSTKILVHTTSSQITHIDFLPSRNDVVLFSSVNGIYAIEIEKTAPQNIQQFYKTSADFRVTEDGIIYIKDGKNLYMYEL